MMTSRIFTVCIFLFFFFTSKAQIHDGHMWFCDTCSLKVTDELRQIPRDGSIWKTKSNWQREDFNIELKFTDSVSFHYTFTEKFGGTTHYYSGKVNTQDSLVFHGFTCSVTKEGDTITKAYFKNNLRDGSFWSFSPKDSTERFTQYEDGLCQGSYRIIKEQNIVLLGQFKDGRRTGVWKYYENGKLMCKGKYSGDLYEGWIPFPDGLFGDGAEVSARIPVRSGKWYFYDVNEKVSRIEFYSKAGYLKRTVYRSKVRRPPNIEDITIREVNL
ncbi:MAG: hypothetical protein GC180_08310 [Bacteroidetes bacterium]|nr:hypothetical protein [Bacteroidota bacterium]